MRRIGSIARDLQRYQAQLERGSTRAVKEASEGLKKDLRQQVMSAGLGGKLANTWRSKVYPEREASLNAVGSVWSKAPHIIRGFDEGVVIRAKSGTFLAIPTENVPKGGRGRRLSPSNWPEHRLGPLRLIVRPGKNALLVSDQVRGSYSSKTGELRGFRKAAKGTIEKGYARKSGHGVTSVIMFVLVPQASFKKSLDVEGAARKWGQRLPSMIEKNVNLSGAMASYYSRN